MENFLDKFESVDGTYENCPLGVPLLVWTGDSFETEYVDICCEYGTCYPANGVEFLYFAELPLQEEAMEYFE